MNTAMPPALVPELDVSNLDGSLSFYVDVLGFSLMWSRPEERFAYLGRDGAELMLEEAAGPGRRFGTAPLEHPFGRGLNIQILVADVDALCARVRGAGHALVVPLEERWYRIGGELAGNRQFVVADPDGYLLRFFSDVGRKPAERPP
jgi:catechol 2,3-dioxygenase-like lactoylglutathione lyase family enzyme